MVRGARGNAFVGWPQDHGHPCRAGVHDEETLCRPVCIRNQEKSTGPKGNALNTMLCFNFPQPVFEGSKAHRIGFGFGLVLNTQCVVV